MFRLKRLDWSWSLPTRPTGSFVCLLYPRWRDFYSQIRLKYGTISVIGTCSHNTGSICSLQAIKKKTNTLQGTNISHLRKGTSSFQRALVKKGRYVDFLRRVYWGASNPFNYILYKSWLTFLRMVSWKLNTLRFGGDEGHPNHHLSNEKYPGWLG